MSKEVQDRKVRKEVQDLKNAVTVVVQMLRDEGLTVREDRVIASEMGRLRDAFGRWRRRRAVASDC